MLPLQNTISKSLTPKPYLNGVTRQLCDTAKKTSWYDTYCKADSGDRAYMRGLLCGRIGLISGTTLGGILGADMPRYTSRNSFEDKASSGIFIGAMLGSLGAASGIFMGVTAPASIPFFCGVYFYASYLQKKEDTNIKITNSIKLS